MFASTRPDLIPPLFCRSQSIWKMARVQMVWPPWRTNLSSTALWLSSSARTFPEKTPSSSLGHPSRASASSQNSANKVCKEVSAADYVCCLFFAWSCSFPLVLCCALCNLSPSLHTSPFCTLKKCGYSFLMMVWLYHPQAKQHAQDSSILYSILR